MLVLCRRSSASGSSYLELVRRLGAGAGGLGHHTRYGDTGARGLGRREAHPGREGGRRRRDLHGLSCLSGLWIIWMCVLCQVDYCIA